jgi:hypothetical protein
MRAPREEMNSSLGFSFVARRLGMLGIQMKFPAGNAIAMPRTVPFGTTTDHGLFVHLGSILPGMDG